MQRVSVIFVSLENLKYCQSKIEFTQANILDKHVIDNLISRVDVVFHMAAAVGVKNIIENPEENLDIEIKMQTYISKTQQQQEKILELEKENLRLFKGMKQL